MPTIYIRLKLVLVRKHIKIYLMLSERFSRTKGQEPFGKEDQVRDYYLLKPEVGLLFLH